MTARPQDVALLPCPFCGGVAEFDSPSVVYGVPWHSIRCCIAKAGGHDRGDVIRRWNTRANVTAALASAQAREDELRALLGGVECQRDANWQAYTEAEARAERLAEALREARDYVASELSDERAKFAGYEHCSSIASIEADLARIDAALSTNAATQTGETT